MVCNLKIMHLRTMATSMTRKKENLFYFFHRKSLRVKPTPERIVIRLVTLDNLLPSLQQSLKHSRMTTVIAYSIKIESLR